MVLREQDKHFLWSLLAAAGVIFVWKGLWEGLYEIPYFGDPWVALFVGLTMLTFSGIVFREFDPLGNIDKSVYKILRFVENHPEKRLFKIKYYDKIKKKEMIIEAEEIRRVEKGTLIIKDVEGNKEFFIPAHRVTEVIYKGKTYWRL